jgi:Ubiquitin-activating enzyme active site
MLGLPYCHDKNRIREIVSKIEVPKFEPKQVTIKASDTDTTQEKAEDDEPACESLIKLLENT